MRLLGLPLASLLGLAVTLGAAAPAQAAPDAQAKAAAEALFREALELERRGAYRDACPKLAEAVRLTEGSALGGILELARCYEKIERVASAWALYREVAAKAATQGQLERQREASVAAAALEAKLHMLELALHPTLLDTPGLVVRIGSVELGRAVWSAATPVDAGEVVIELRATSKRTLTRKVTIPSKAGTTRLDLPPLEDESAPPGAPLAEKPRGDTKAPVEPPQPSLWSGARIGGGIGIGAGLVGMGIGTAIAVSAKSDWDAPHESGACDAANVCSAAGKSAIDAARQSGTIATVLFAASAGIAAVGLVIFIAAPRASAAPTTPGGLRLRASASPSGAALGAETAF